MRVCIICVCEREGGIDSERETDRQSETERQRQKDRDRGKVGYMRVAMNGA